MEPPPTIRRLTTALAASDAARGAAAALDRSLLSFMRAQSARAERHRRRRGPGAAERIEELNRLTDRIAERQGEWRGPLFGPARTITPTRRHEHWLADGASVQDIDWPSDYRPFLPEVDERYRRHSANLRGAARLWLHREPHPAAILIHGYMGGAYRLEERMWPVRWLFDSGLDLALFVLPLHGLRRIRGRRGPPPFPSRDPRMTNEGFRHGLGDLRDLTGWLLRRGHGTVGVMGMSLGGYLVALATTVMPELSFAMPVVPLTSLADFARDHGKLDADPKRAAKEHRALERVHRIVSPLARTPRLAPDRMLVVAGRADRVTPIGQAGRLADHLDAPLCSFAGGHLLPIGRGGCFRRARRLWRTSGGGTSSPPAEAS